MAYRDNDGRVTCYEIGDEIVITDIGQCAIVRERIYAHDHGGGIGDVPGYIVEVGGVGGYRHYQPHTGTLLVAEY